MAKSEPKESVVVKETTDGCVITVIYGPGIASASGKSLTLASTRGNLSLPSGVKLGLNIYRPK